MEKRINFLQICGRARRFIQKRLDCGVQAGSLGIQKQVSSLDLGIGCMYRVGRKAKASASNDP